jgi:hypothetical protein
MADLPIVITSAGPQPQSPATILQTLIANVLATNPGFTATLPASLVEDLTSTSVAGIALADSFWVDLVNSLTVFGANPFLLNQLGQMFGVPLGLTTNTSVFVQFTGTPGFTISPGFTVSDGTNQYTVIDGGVVGTASIGPLGVTPLLFCVATQPGSFAVPSGTVQGIITSVPTTITLSVNNPSTGTPSTAAQTEQGYRADVNQAGLAASSGMTTMLKTALRNVSGVQTQLISVIIVPNGGGYEILVGGGDPNQVGAAIIASGLDLNSIVGSTLAVSNATQANPCVITTDLNHGFATGQVIGIADVVGMTELNGTTPTITVINETSFSLNGVNSTGFPAFISGGVITPNFRNIPVSIVDFPDTYNIVYVNPPQQTVLVTLTWNTSSPNFVQATAVAQAAAPAISAYINSITVGQPLNVFQMQAAFVASVANILQPQQITRMVFEVTINGVAATPEEGTEVIAGDPESFFFTTPTSITVEQG